MSAVTDREALQGWWSFCRAHPGKLPPQCELVQSRLVRAVGRAELPETGSVHLKVMGFPRAKDRLRYVHRSLPGPHEARLLGVVAAAGIACPQVVAAFGARRFGLPHVSLLVTRTLPVVAAAPSSVAVIGVVAALVAAGVFHPDLHPGNFVALRDGEVAVLDLQSARLRRPGLSAGDRATLAERLLSGWPELDPGELVASGLLDDGQVAAARANAVRWQRRALLGRIDRCLRTSTEFVATRRWNGVLHRRRGASLDGPVVHGGGTMVRYWIGDRAREVLDGAPPVLSALFRKSCWLPGRSCVYSSAGCDAVSAYGDILLDGFERQAALRRGVGRAVAEEISE